MDNNLRLYFCEATQIIIPDANCSEPHAAHFSSISHCFQHVWEPWIIANTTLSTTYNCISVRVALISPWFPNGTTIVFSIHALIYMWYLQWNPLSYLDHCTGITLHIFFFFDIAVTQKDEQLWSTCQLHSFFQTFRKWNTLIVKCLWTRAVMKVVHICNVDVIA